MIRVSYNVVVDEVRARRRAPARGGLSTKVWAVGRQSLKFVRGAGKVRVQRNVFKMCMSMQNACRSSTGHQRRIGGSNAAWGLYSPTSTKCLR